MFFLFEVVTQCLFSCIIWRIFSVFILSFKCIGNDKGLLNHFFHQFFDISLCESSQTTNSLFTSKLFNFNENHFRISFILFFSFNFNNFLSKFKNTFENFQQFLTSKIYITTGIIFRPKI